MEGGRGGTKQRWDTLKPVLPGEAASVCRLTQVAAAAAAADGRVSAPVHTSGQSEWPRRRGEGPPPH